MGAPAGEGEGARAVSSLAGDGDILPTTPARRGRLAPADCYPAGDDRVAARFVHLPTGERARVLTTGAPSAPPVVLVHGWACSAYSWRHQLPALAGAGFRAIAVELRGHGLSDKPVADELYSAAAMAESVVQLLDVLELPRVAMVGHSLGAAIAARAAARQPGRVARLAAISGVGFGATRMVRTLGRLPDRLVRPLLPLGSSRSLFRVVLRMVAGGPGRYSARDVDEYWAATQFPGFVPALWRLIRAHDWDALDDHERSLLDLPLLTLFGGRDRLVRDSGLGGAGWSESHTLSGVGHAAQEEAPALVNALLLPFLEPWRTEYTADRGLAAGAG